VTYVPVKRHKGHEKHALGQWFSSQDGGYRFSFRICNVDFCECLRDCCYQRKGQVVTNKEFDALLNRVGFDIQKDQYSEMLRLVNEAVRSSELEGREMRDALKHCAEALRAIGGSRGLVADHGDALDEALKALKSGQVN
jgi:hypothetical protein